MPGVLQMPICKPFFARHDWYDTYVREIKQEEDDFRWQGHKAYPMRWEADGETLAVWIDRETMAPIGIETDELFVSAVAQDIEPLQGSETAIRWTITNKSDVRKQFLIDARGADGLDIDHREAFAVQPGASVEHVARVKVGESAKNSLDDGTAPVVRSVITYGHHEIELFTGMRARTPLNLGTSPGQIVARPGRPAIINLELHSELDEPVEGQLWVNTPDGVTADWREQSYEIEPKKWTSLPIAVTCEHAGLHKLDVRTTRKGAKEPIKETITVTALPAGGLVADVSEKSVRIETDSVRIEIKAKNGSVGLHNPINGDKLGGFGIRVGPPFTSSAAHRREFSLSFKMDGPQAVVRLTAEHEKVAGLLMTQVVRVSPTGLVTSQAWMENHSADLIESRLQFNVDRPWYDNLFGAIPLQEGIVTAPMSIWPRGHAETPRDPSAYPEPWHAWTDKGWAAGIAWGPAVNDVRLEWGPQLLGPQQPIEPGTQSRAISMAMYAQKGAWADARRVLNAWTGAKARSLAVRGLLKADIAPGVLLTVADETKTELVCTSAARRELPANVSLTCDPPLSANMEPLTLAELLPEKPHRKPVCLTVPGRPGVYTGRARIHNPLTAATTPFSVVRLGLGGDVDVQQKTDQAQNVWSIANGLTTIKVAPDFGPSVYAWEYQGENQLNSHFPEPKSFAFDYPYFGGIHPLVTPKGSWYWIGYLHKYNCDVEALTSTDVQGIPWQGVRLTSLPTHKDLKGMIIELDVLTVGQSPVLKAVLRVKNTRQAAHAVSMGLDVNLALGASPRELLLTGEGLRSEPHEQGMYAPQQRWAMLQNPATGRSAMTVADGDVIGGYSAGTDGKAFNTTEDVYLKELDTFERTYWYVLGDSPEAVRPFVALGAL